MRFVVLGSGTNLPDAQRGPAGFLVTVGSQSWLVDGGSGTLQRCAAAGVDPRTLAGGFYSHRHPDHTGDLVPLLFAMRCGHRAADYPIYAGGGFGAFLDGLRGVYGRWIDLEAPARATVTELPLDGPGTVDLGALVVHTRPAVHSGGALHLRFEAEGRSVVFSGDTGPSEALVELTEGADLLVTECAGGDDAPFERHLFPSAVADLVRRARPREVWLTHFYEGVDVELAAQTVGTTGVPTRRAADLDAWSG